MSDLPNKLNNMHEMFRLDHTIRNVDMVKEAADLIEQLTATTDRLLKVCMLAYDSYDRMLMTDPPQCAWKANRVTTRLFEAITSTSQHNLEDRDAEVARKAFLDGFNSSGQGFNGEYGGEKDVLDKLANEYVSQLKRGE